MIGSFYTFIVEASQHMLEIWLEGSQQVLALMGAGGKASPAPAPVAPAVPGSALPLSARQRKVLERW